MSRDVNLLDSLVKTLSEVSNQHEVAEVTDRKGNILQIGDNTATPQDFWKDFGYQVIKYHLDLDPLSIVPSAIRKIKGTKKKPYGKIQVVFKNSQGREIRV